ncbi:MAG: SurA N-terminal domain-containing protein, partial [Herminiimonas sp.]|nr:SurA N-terminal domain-containing protein [Herminiimonas sp.]
MFEFIRSHQRLMQFALLLFIVPSFAFVGLESYSRFGDGDNVIAKVGGQSITKPEWDAAQREQMERFRQMFGAQFDPKMFDTPEARKGILDNLIGQRALAVEASADNLAVSDLTLQQTILAIPGMTGPDGKFDSERYKSALAAQGMTPSMYESRLRQDLVLQQVNSAVQATAFSPKTVSARLSDLNDQERAVQELAFKASDFASQVKITDDMLKDYYSKNATQFEVPEQAAAEYVVLNSDTISSQIVVTDADIKTYYDNNLKQRYMVEEQRRASHILIALKKDASTADKTAAKAKADKLLAQVRQTPSAFADVAKKNSDDPGSAERGGDLDFFAKGMMVKPFSDAAYSMKQGDISDVVKSEFGYHIIQVTAIKPAQVKPLDDVKADITAEIKKQLAAKKYAELAEIFTNTVYEQADSLKPVADKLKLTIQSAANLNRKPSAAAAPGAPFNNDKFLTALFADDVVKNKHNTEAVAVAPNTLISGRIVDYKPATKRPFEQVQAVIRERVMQIEAVKLAKKAGEEKLAALKGKDDAAGFAELKVASRNKNPGFD